MPDQVQLDLPIVLPNVPGTEDACVDRLTASLREQEGVGKAHVIGRHQRRAGPALHPLRPGDDLSRLPFAVGLSRQTRRIIRQNLWIALGMVAVLVPAAILGLQIGPAVVLHEGSTLVVVFNALRLLSFRGDTVTS